jgi:hypothetical protein
MFLTEDRHEKLSDLFADKMCYVKSKSGKSKTQMLYIPVGVNALTFKSVEERKTRNGKPMFVFQFTKPPEERGNRQTKISYKPISCYHMVGSGDNNWKNLWYKGFTTTMSRSQLESFRSMTGKKVKAVVRQHERLVKDEDGDVQYGMNGIAYWIEPEIVSVHKVDERVELITEDYLNLLVYDKG